ncbi:MAG TPA: hypothetical protein PKE27_03985 [Povalibacter sp.]|nr:hypothetical protein [Povalibacter sp.]
MQSPAADGSAALPSLTLGTRTTRQRPAQNWILNPLQDSLFVIGTPLLVLTAALVLFRSLGAAAATSLIIVAHIIFTVAHHLPTFIRIYGDTELFQRYRWHFLMAPVIPLTFSALVLGYLNHRDYAVENFLYLYIMLALWDPWHFMRQHYGFVRIYDRHNVAPRALAARMDLWLCAIWFGYIMLASSAWLADLLSDFEYNVGLPFVRYLPVDAVATVIQVAGVAAVLTTFAYAAYLLWCRINGYYISVAKLALLATTFGVMYLAYVPNAWMQATVPGWSFKVGFAIVGLVHMTQYLAIVWRYNRNLATRPGAARAGWFQHLHRRGGWLIGAGYVIVCLAYGELVTTERAGRWIMSVLLAIGFTSTLLHYYFDGFIWKLRQQRNREHLSLDESPRMTEAPTTRPEASARSMLLRQTAYFGVPMLILSVGAFSILESPTVRSVDRMYQAQALSDAGRLDEALREARLALTSMNDEAVIAHKLAQLDPSAARQAELAFLIYNRSFYGHVVLPAASGRGITSADREAHRRDAGVAAALLEHALAQHTSLAHPGRLHFDRPDAERTLAAWQRTAAPIS